MPMILYLRKLYTQGDKWLESRPWHHLLLTLSPLLGDQVEEQVWSEGLTKTNAPDARWGPGSVLRSRTQSFTLSRSGELWTGVTRNRAICAVQLVA